MDGDRFEIVTRRVPVKRLDDYGFDPSFVKLDVQGYELDALRGLAATIDRARPVLLVESPRPEIRRWLADKDYRAFQYLPDEHRLVSDSDHGHTLNVVFLPREDPAGST